MCGSLQMGWYLVILSGMLLLLRFFSLEGLKRICSDWSIVFCVVVGVIMHAATGGQMLYHWDDGSHWYRMCKALYFDGHYPTTPDIVYYDYVPGTATWVCGFQHPQLPVCTELHQYRCNRSDVLPG